MEKHGRNERDGLRRKVYSSFIIHHSSLFLILLSVALLPGCNQPQGSAAQPQVVAENPPVAVDVAPVKAADIDETLDLVGGIKSKFEATVRSEYAGTLADVFITEWVSVKKGDPLARIDMRENEAKIKQGEAEMAQARADLLSAQAASERARRDFDRVAQLKKEEIISEQSLDAARQQRDTTAAQVAASQARLSVAQEALNQSRVKQGKSILRAPMDGVVANRHANVGQFVDNMGQGEPLFRIVDNRILDVTLAVPAAEQGKVRIGQPVIFATDSLPGKSFTAAVTHINPAVDPATRTVSVSAEITNGGELHDGMFVKGRIVVGRRNGVLQIPRPALLPAVTAGGAELFVIENGVARKRTVQTGREAPDTVEVTAGLKAGEQVVTRGGFMLQEGDKVKISQL